MNKPFWSLESWGEDAPPANANEIIEAANALISACLKRTGDADALSERLWDRYCMDGTLVAMTSTQYALACSEAPNYSDPDAFVSDLLTSSAFAPAAPEAELDLTQAPALRRIWTAATAPFRDLLRELGLGQTELARRYQIPLRTVQNWASGVNDCPVYTRLMIARLEGYIQAP